MEELVFIYLIDDHLHTMERQHSRTTKQGKVIEANNKCDQKQCKKGVLSEYCLIQNTKAKKNNEHNLETNATACKYPLLSLKLQILCLFQARSSLTIRKL